MREYRAPWSVVFLLVLAALLGLGGIQLVGCSHLRVQEVYYRADLATYEVVEPVVRLLADDDPANDPDLTGVNGRALLQTLETWKLRLDKAGEQHAE